MEQFRVVPGPGRRRAPHPQSQRRGFEQEPGLQTQVVGECADPFAGDLEQLRGLGLVALPRRVRRMLGGRPLPGGQVGPPQPVGPLEGGEPFPDEPSAVRSVEPLDRQQCGSVRRPHPGGLHDRRVTEEPLGGDVPLGRDPVPGHPQLPGARQLPAVAQARQPGQSTPGVRRGRCRARLHQVPTLRLEPLTAAELVEPRQDLVRQFVQEQHVIGCVVQPRRRQRATRPVGGGVRLGQADPEVLRDHRPEVDPLGAEETSGQLGVDERGRRDPQLTQRREVLTRGVEQQGPGRQDVGEGADGPTRGLRVHEQGGAGRGAELQEEGPVRVPDPRGAFDVDRDGAGRGSQGVGDRLDGGDVVDELVLGRGWLRPGRGLAAAAPAHDRRCREVTPTGGRPAARASVVQKADAWPVRSGSRAVQDARSSSWWDWGGPAMSP